MNEFYKVASSLSEEGESFCVVTLTGVRGGAPQEIGAKAIMTSDGLFWGTIGGGKLEFKAIEEVKTLLKNHAVLPLETRVWNLTRDVGMSCGGEVTLLFETVTRPSLEIAVFGAGHVSQALIRALLPLECRITCIDPREEWLSKLPSSRKLQIHQAPEPNELVKSFSNRTYFIVMTQGHATDVPILSEILSRFSDAPYIGCIGSEVKAIKLKSELRTLGIEDEKLKKLICPIGLPIGKSTPPEIAVSITAQVLGVSSSNAS